MSDEAAEKRRIRGRTSDFGNWLIDEATMVLLCYASTKLPAAAVIASSAAPHNVLRLNR